MSDLLVAAGGVLTSGGMGAIVGLVGGALTRWQQYKLEKVQLEHEAKMRDLDVKEAALERKHDLDIIDKNINKAEAEGKIAYQVADLDNLKASIQADRDTGIPSIEKLKGAMRPYITLFLMVSYTGFMGYLTYKLNGLSALSHEKLVELYIYGIESYVFLSITAVGWWFASRVAYNQKK